MSKTHYRGRFLVTILPVRQLLPRGGIVVTSRLTKDETYIAEKCMFCAVGDKYNARELILVRRSHHDSHLITRGDDI